jgi:hypothetical protein
MEQPSSEEKVGVINPYVLADRLDESYGKPKKNWKKIILGLDLNFSDVESALRDSLVHDFKKAAYSIFHPEGSLLYMDLKQLMEIHKNVRELKK